MRSLLRFPSLLLTALVLLGFVNSTSATAQTETVLHAFAGRHDGRGPASGVVFDGAGNLYGTTIVGGTVFKLSPNPDGSWTETVLHDFRYEGNPYPLGPLVFDTEGNIYGVTAVGGGHGTVFVLKPDGSGGFQETVLHTFTGGADGDTPVGGLVFDTDGNLYGTTFYGGINTAGTVFELALDQSGNWTKTTIYTFSGVGHPTGLVLDKNLRLYGMTSAGGNKGAGTAFQLARDQFGTWIETDIYDFDVNVGSASNTTPILDARGNLYGTNIVVGNPGVFELQHRHENWQLTELQRFPSITPLTSSLVFDALGNLYGTTAQGGAFGLGMVYRLSPSGHGWTRNILYNFRGKADGGYSIGRLAVDAQGNLYGTAEEGGQYGYGVVYEVTP